MAELGIDWPTDKQLEQVWAKLEALKPGELMIIAKHAPNKPELFVQCIKMWIDCYGNGEFNNDYTKFKKLEPWQKEFSEGE